MKSRRLEDCHSELEQAVFRSVYDSSTQRRLRLAAALVLAIKHVARGLLFLLPVLLAGIAALLSPGIGFVIGGLLLLPVLALAAWIGLKGVRADYRDKVVGQILDRQGLMRRLVY